MNTYKLTISYNGFGFFGWQTQKGTVPTIQENIEKALRKICKGNEVSTLGSGRTDADVHALGQVVKIQIPYEIPIEDLKLAINNLTDAQIKVLNIEKVSSDFHPIYQAKAKEYHYVFRDRVSSFDHQYVARSPKNLNYDLIQKALKELKGEKDFVNYMCTGTPVKSTIRTIFAADLKQMQSYHLGELSLDGVYLIKLKGNGFLKQMVRLLVGALWKVGEGKLSIDEYVASFETELAQKLAPVAPGHGLYLYAVEY